MLHTSYITKQMSVTQDCYRIYKLKYKKKIIKYQTLTKLLTQNKKKKDSMTNKKKGLEGRWQDKNEKEEMGKIKKKKTT